MVSCIGQKTQLQVHNAQSKVLYTSWVAVFILRVLGQNIEGNHSILHCICELRLCNLQLMSVDRLVSWWPNRRSNDSCRPQEALPWLSLCDCSKAKCGMAAKWKGVGLGLQSWSIPLVFMGQTYTCYMWKDIFYVAVVVHGLVVEGSLWVQKIRSVHQSFVRFF